MNILVIDGQGGGIGRSLAEELRRSCPDAEIIAVGTNAMATANMLKVSGVNGATGENAVVFNSSRADIITGPIGIIMANSMFGEITIGMAEAVASSSASIFLIPVSKCHASVVGVADKKMSEYIEEAVSKISVLCN